MHSDHSHYRKDQGLLLVKVKTKSHEDKWIYQTVNYTIGIKLRLHCNLLLVRKKKKAGAGAKGVCGCETLIRAYDGRDGR